MTKHYLQYSIQTAIMSEIIMTQDLSSLCSNSDLLGVGELALVTAGALSTLEGVTGIATGSALGTSSSLTTATAQSSATLDLFLFSALLAAAGLVLECFLGVEFLLTGTENPFGTAVLANQGLVGKVGFLWGSVGHFGV